MASEDPYSREGSKRTPQEDVLKEHSFDKLAKGLASHGISRGRALTLVGTAIVGGFLGIFTLQDETDAKKKGKGKGKKNKKKCNGGSCPSDNWVCCPPIFGGGCCPPGLICCPAQVGGHCCEPGDLCLPPGVGAPNGACVKIQLA